MPSPPPTPASPEAPSARPPCECRRLSPPDPFRSPSSSTPARLLDSSGPIPPSRSARVLDPGTPPGLRTFPMTDEDDYSGKSARLPPRPEGPQEPSPGRIPGFRPPATTRRPVGPEEVGPSPRRSSEPLLPSRPGPVVLRQGFSPAALQAAGDWGVGAPGDCPWVPAALQAAGETGLQRPPGILPGLGPCGPSGRSA